MNAFDRRAAGTDPSGLTLMGTRSAVAATTFGSAAHETAQSDVSGEDGMRARHVAGWKSADSALVVTSASAPCPSHGLWRRDYASATAGSAAWPPLAATFGPLGVAPSACPRQRPVCRGHGMSADSVLTVSSTTQDPSPSTPPAAAVPYAAARFDAFFSDATGPRAPYRTLHLDGGLLPPVAALLATVALSVHGAGSGYTRSVCDLLTLGCAGFTGTSGGERFERASLTLGGGGGVGAHAFQRYRRHVTFGLFPITAAYLVVPAALPVPTLRLVLRLRGGDVGCVAPRSAVDLGVGCSAGVNVPGTFGADVPVAPHGAPWRNLWIPVPYDYTKGSPSTLPVPPALGVANLQPHLSRTPPTKSTPPAHPPFGPAHPGSPARPTGPFVSLPLAAVRPCPPPQAPLRLDDGPPPPSASDTDLGDWAQYGLGDLDYWCDETRLTGPLCAEFLRAQDADFRARRSIDHAGPPALPAPPTLDFAGPGPHRSLTPSTVSALPPLPALGPADLHALTDPTGPSVGLRDVQGPTVGSHGLRLSGDRWQIWVKGLAGETIPVDASGGDRVAGVKAVLQRRLGVPDDLQRLLFSGRQLQDDRTLADYNIGRGSTVHLVLRLRGGVVEDWTTAGRDPAIDAAVQAIRAGAGSDDFKNRRIEALALNFDLRESGVGKPVGATRASSPSLVAALERQAAIDTERREDERRRLDREADRDTPAKRAYAEVFEHLYGNTRYPEGDARRGGILNTYDPHEAQLQIVWWAEKGELVIEDVLLYAHLVWASSPTTYAAIVMRYRDLPSRIRAHNVVVTEQMEKQHKGKHPQFKTRNLPKIVGCPYPLLPPVCDEFIRLNQDILDTSPEVPPSVSGGGSGGPLTKGTRLPTAFKHATSVGATFRVSIRPPVSGGEPWFFLEGPDAGGRYAVDMAPADQAFASLSAEVKRLGKAVQALTPPSAPAPAGKPARGQQQPQQRSQQQPQQPQQGQAQRGFGQDAHRRQPRGRPAGGDATPPPADHDGGMGGDPSQ